MREKRRLESSNRQSGSIVPCPNAGTDKASFPRLPGLSGHGHEDLANLLIGFEISMRFRYLVPTLEESCIMSLGNLD